MNWEKYIYFSNTNSYLDIIKFLNMLRSLPTYTIYEFVPTVALLYI